MKRVTGSVTPTGACPPNTRGPANRGASRIEYLKSSCQLLVLLELCSCALAFFETHLPNALRSFLFVP